MSFTDEEVRRWREEKRQREQRQTPSFASAPVATCIHCQRPFGIGDGVQTNEVALCDICNGE